MNIDDKWDFVVKTMKEVQEQSDRLEKVTDVLLISPESPLLDVQYRIEGALINTLSLLINDDFENLHWFVYESDFGRKPMKAGLPGDMRLIDSYEKLRWLIEIYFFCKNICYFTLL